MTFCLVGDFSAAKLGEGSQKGDNGNHRYPFRPLVDYISLFRITRQGFVM
jgi:hypothetical protein